MRRLEDEEEPGDDSAKFRPFFAPLRPDSTMGDRNVHSLVLRLLVFPSWFDDRWPLLQSLPLITPAPEDPDCWWSSRRWRFNDGIELTLREEETDDDVLPVDRHVDTAEEHDRDEVEEARDRPIKFAAALRSCCAKAVTTSGVAIACDKDLMMVIGVGVGP